jgi:hypothetical protein
LDSTSFPPISFEKSTKFFCESLINSPQNEAVASVWQVAWRLRDQSCPDEYETALKEILQERGKAQIVYAGEHTLYQVRFVNAVGHVREHFIEDFKAANTLAKSLREFCSKVSVRKIGQVSPRWDVYLFAPELPGPQLIQKNLRTYTARLTWVRWDHREHHSVLVCWPSDHPIPASWVSSS